MAAMDPGKPMPSSKTASSRETVDSPPPENPFPRHIRTVGIAAPAGVPDPVRLARGIQRLRRWGLKVVDGTAQLSADRFLAASDEKRTQHLLDMIADPTVDAIVAARGGYGCARILPLLGLERLAEKAVPLIGYSDLTALHLAAFGAGSKNQVFGPMLTGEFAREPATEHEAAALKRTFGSLSRALAPQAGVDVTSANLHTLKPGVAEGPVVPANLAVLTSLAGTPFLPKLKGAILVLEDVNEAAYRIDRYLNQLSQNGVLRQLAGLVYGQFSQCEDANWVPGVLRDWAERVSGPVVTGLPFGHTSPSISLPTGPNVRLDAGPEAVTFQYTGAPPEVVRHFAMK